MKSLLLDLIGLIGATCLIYGAWLVHPSAGFGVAGVLLLTASITGAKRWA